jgi:hypothetical protein
MCLWCCWKDIDEQDFNGIYLVRFGFKMWEILVFLLVISTTENSNKISKKPGFWKEKSVEDIVTLGPTAQATHYGGDEIGPNLKLDRVLNSLQK